MRRGAEWLIILAAALLLVGTHGTKIVVVRVVP